MVNLNDTWEALKYPLAHRRTCQNCIQHTPGCPVSLTCNAPHRGFPKFAEGHPDRWEWSGKHLTFSYIDGIIPD